MAIKLDHELDLTRRQSWDMQNFETDIFMMVSRPSDANSGGTKPKYDFSKVAKKSLAENSGFLWVQGVKMEAREARRGPNKGHLDSKIDKKNENSISP